MPDLQSQLEDRGNKNGHGMPLHRHTMTMHALERIRELVPPSQSVVQDVSASTTRLGE